MTITSGKRSSVQNPQRYISANAGNPGLMAAPTATDGGTGSTVSCAFTTVTGNTSYEVLSNPGSLTATGTASPIVVSGLTAGTAYTFQIRGVNANSTGAYSAASNSVTPAVPSSFESIATAVGDGSGNTITFSSIPNTYKHLQIRATYQDGKTANTFDDLYLRFNGTSGVTCAYHFITATSSAATAGRSINDNTLFVPGAGWGTGGDGNTVGVSIIDILDYANTSKNKTIRSFSGADGNTGTTASRLALSSGVWISTSAISSITLSFDDTSFTSKTTFALYGIKG